MRGKGVLSKKKNLYDVRMDRKSIALDKFMSGYNCAQAVLYSFTDYLEIDKNFALRISSGFGMGMGKTLNVCGAISGAIMAINMKYDDGEEIYKKIQSVVDLFEERHGSVVCSELTQNCTFVNTHGHFDECNVYVQTAVEALEELIIEEQKRSS